MRVHACGARSRAPVGGENFEDEDEDEEATAEEEKAVVMRSRRPSSITVRRSGPLY